MKRISILGKDTVLWNAGDIARTIGLVEKGKLGIRSEQGMAGFILPKMVLGEAAILGLFGHEPRRTAEVFAVDEDTTVSEYPVSYLKGLGDEPTVDLRTAVLGTLLGQICRNCLLILRAHQGSATHAQPFRGLIDSLVNTNPARMELAHSFDGFTLAFRFLVETRDYTDGVRRLLVPESYDRKSAQKASEVIVEILTHQGDTNLIAEFMKAEEEAFELDDSALRLPRTRGKAL